MIQDALKVFEKCGVVETVHDSLIHRELEVQILFLHYRAILLHFQRPALAAEGAENRQVAEIIQVVVNNTLD